MTFFEALFLGVVQGATEFVPVSSSGHLVLIPWLLGWDPPGLTFTLAAHLGTTLAVIVYFFKEWRDMGAGVWHWLTTREQNDDFRLLLLVIYGCIPVAIVGLLLRSQIEASFESPTVAAFMLSITAALLIVADQNNARNRTELTEATWLDALVIGLVQVLAVLPGISRSGATIAGGLARKLTREAAARYSFIVSLPVIIGAELLQFATVLQNGLDSLDFGLLITAAIAAFLSGYLVIWWLLDYLKKRSTNIFAIYCVTASIICIIILFQRGTFGT